MKNHTFVVIACAPEGVTASEIADHLADASRSMCQEYAASDPLSSMPDIRIFGTLPRAELPASSAAAHSAEARTQPQMPVRDLG